MSVFPVHYEMLILAVGVFKFKRQKDNGGGIGNSFGTAMYQAWINLLLVSLYAFRSHHRKLKLVYIKQTNKARKLFFYDANVSANPLRVLVADNNANPIPVNLLLPLNPNLALLDYVIFGF